VGEALRENDMMIKGVLEVFGRAIKNETKNLYFWHLLYQVSCLLPRTTSR